MDSGHVVSYDLWLINNVWNFLFFESSSDEKKIAWLLREFEGQLNGWKYVDGFVL